MELYKEVKLLSSHSPLHSHFPCFPSHTFPCLWLLSPLLIPFWGCSWSKGDFRGVEVIWTLPLKVIHLSFVTEPTFRGLLLLTPLQSTQEMSQHQFLSYKKWNKPKSPSISPFDFVSVRTSLEQPLPLPFPLSQWISRVSYIITPTTITEATWYTWECLYKFARQIVLISKWHSKLIVM